MPKSYFIIGQKDLDWMEKLLTRYLPDSEQECFKAKPAVRSSVHIWRSVLNTAPAKKDERAKSSGLQQLLKMCSLGTSYWKNILQQCVKNF